MTQSNSFDAMQDARFYKAFSHLMKLEGGGLYHKVEGDNGGATKYGISLRTLQATKLINGDIDNDGDIDAQDIKALSEDDAIQFYENWWQRYSYGDFHIIIGIKLFEMSVNFGPSQAHKVLQRAVRAQPCGTYLKDDGILGPKTRKAVKACDPDILLSALKSEQAGVYRMIAARNPSQRKFLKGWLNRAYT